MQQLTAELEELRAKLSATERDFKQIQTVLGKVENEHSTCESGRNSLERIIAELKGKILNNESRLEALGNERSGNAEKLARLMADLRDLHEKLERAQAMEKYLKSDFEKRDRDMKSAFDALEALYEKALQEASDNASAGRGLLDAVSGHVVERKGVGMVVRTVADGVGNLSSRTAKSQDFLVKQLIPGSSATLCAKIAVNDIVVAVDGTRIAGMQMEQVIDLILGPEGTTVTITGLKLKPTGGERYSVKLMRGDPGSGVAKPFAEEAKEAIDSLNNVHHEANKARTMCKTLEDQVSELTARISQLDSVVSSRDNTVSQLNAEIELCKSKLATSDREKGVAQEVLADVKDKHCSCEEGRKDLNKTVDGLTATIKV